MTERLAQDFRRVLVDVAGGSVSIDEGLLRLRDALLPPLVAGEKVAGLARRPLYTTHEVARIFRVTPMTVIRWVDAGRLPAQKTAGGHRRIPATAIVAVCRELHVEIPDQVIAAAASMAAP